VKNTIKRNKNIVENTRFSHWVGMRNISDYSPFGVLLPERTSSTAFYRRGFQGQEHDDEVKGDGNSVNFKYRMHDPRIGRFFVVDPLTLEYPYYSPYVFSGNRLIDAVEIEGLEPSKKEGWSTSKTPGASDHKINFWYSRSGKIVTYYKPIFKAVQNPIKASKEGKGKSDTKVSSAVQEGYSDPTDDNSIISGFISGSGANGHSIFFTDKSSACYESWRRTRTKMSTIESFTENYMLTMASVPLGGSGRIISALTDGGLNLAGQLLANNGDWSKVDVLSTGIATISGLIPGGSKSYMPYLIGIAAAGADALVDYSQKDKLRTFVGENKKSLSLMGNDFLWNSAGNLGGATFNSNPWLYKTIGTGLTGIPTTVINSTINNELEPEQKN
jgi:RHS repeat-associated protein